MSRLTIVVASAVAVILAACADSRSAPTTPTASPSLSQSAAGSGKTDDVDRGRVVRMLDQCDPTTFDAALRDPHACVGNGHVTFDHFIAQLQRNQRADAWRFDPMRIELERGASLTAVNAGGEVHTFTRVAKFGGGIVPLLNTLSGTPDVAPECTTLGPDDFVAPGAMYTAELSDGEHQLFQCCIHPWMRAELKLKHGHHAEGD